MLSWIRDLEEYSDLFRRVFDEYEEKVCAAVYHSLFCSRRVGTLRRFGLQCILYLYLSYMGAGLV
jgi:hypothetical protein